MTATHAHPIPTAAERTRLSRRAQLLEDDGGVVVGELAGSRAVLVPGISDRSGGVRRRGQPIGSSRTSGGRSSDNGSR